jgi:antirestriction protein ArdC
MNTKVKKVIDNLLVSFESGAVPDALAIVVLPRQDVPASHWSLCNRLILFFAGTSDARGFRQWKDAGRYPKKGSKAIYILSPRHKKVVDDETEEEKRLLTGFLAVPVFRVEDTDGTPLDVPELTPNDLPPLYEVAHHWHLSVNWQSFHGRAYGSYSPGRNEIVLATHDEQVFFHELAHAAHHRVTGQLRKGQDWKQEIVAELTAAVLAHLYGRRPNDGFSYRYIRSYAEDAGKDIYRACVSVIAEVGTCVDVILHAHEGAVVAA